MMMPLHFPSNHHGNTTDQTQWIEEKWDLTLQMIRYNGKPHYPVWLIEAEEDLFLTSFTQIYQSKRMMMPNWNNQHQTQWIQEKWDWTIQWFWYSGMLHHPVWLIEVEEDLFLTTLFQLYQSKRMMMPNWNNQHQTQWIQEKWDWTIQWFWYSGMLHHPVWLIEVEEDLFLISFILHYPLTRMMVSNWNIRHQSLRFQALPTLSFQTTSLIGMPYCWYWTISMNSVLSYYIRRWWIRATITDGALLNA